MTPRLVVTGANGFVGRHLVRAAVERRWEVLGLVRSGEAARVVSDAGGRAFQIRELAEEGLAAPFAGAQVVVHLAQIGSEREGATYEAVNVRGSAAVAAAASAAGVPRLVVFSGLGVARYGQAPRCTNRYFLSKLASELAAYRSACEVVALRPSYIVGPGDGLITHLLADMAAGQVEIPGDGSYRLQPIAVGDAAATVLAVASRPAASGRERHRAVDLVGPEPLAFRDFVRRVGEEALAQGLPARFAIREVPTAEADRQARAGGWHGMPPDELDCLLCDEVADPAPVTALLGRELTPAASVIAVAVRAGR